MGKFSFIYNPWIIFTPLPSWSFSYTLTLSTLRITPGQFYPGQFFFSLALLVLAAIDKHDLYAWLASFLILGNRVCGVGIVLELNNLGHTVSQSVEKQRQVFG